MRKQTTCYICDKPIEPEWLPEGEFTICDECSSDTDEISVDELQKIRITELKDFSKKILQAELKNQKLQEQLNTAKKALTEISLIPTKFDDGGAGEIAVEIARDSLEALEGGEDDSVGSIRQWQWEL